MTEAATSTASEWYIITYDAALTLRITPGLTLGEAAHGELALSHKDTAAQWVRLDPAIDGTLKLRVLDAEASVTLDDNPVGNGGVEVVAGTMIQLPNNRLLISNHFRGQNPAGALLRIRHNNAYAGPPLLTTGVSRAVPVDSDTTVPLSGSWATRPPQGPNRAPLRSRENQATPVMREHRSGQLEVALQRRRDAAGSLLKPTRSNNPTEDALVPVAAEAPFAEEELKTFLERPIDLRNTDSATIPILTTTTVPRVPDAAAPRRPAKRRLIYLGTFAVVVLFGLASVLLTAVLDPAVSPEDALLPPLSGDSLVLLPVPEEAPTEPQVQRPTEALLRSVDKVIAEGDATDVSVWDFAIRTYEFVLGQEPDNAAARLRLQEARQTLAALEAGTEPATQPPQKAEIDGSVVAAIAEAADEVPAPPATLTAAQSELLDVAEQRLDVGQAVSPSGAAAVPLILAVLKDVPTDPRAFRLLTRSADQLLREAEAAWAANNQYLARNILEEVFAFHPRHPQSNLRWTEWTGLPPRVPPATMPAATN